MATVLDLTLPTPDPPLPRSPAPPRWQRRWWMLRKRWGLPPKQLSQGVSQCLVVWYVVVHVCQRPNARYTELLSETKLISGMVISMFLYTVDKTLHGWNVLHSFEFVTYVHIFAQNQFISYQQCSNWASTISCACVCARSSLLSPFPSHLTPVQGILKRLWSTSLKPSSLTLSLLPCSLNEQG